MRAVGTREGSVVAYLKARVFPRHCIPAIEMAGYPYYAPMGLAFPLATPIMPLRGLAALRPLPKPIKNLRSVLGWPCELPQGSCNASHTRGQVSKSRRLCALCVKNKAGGEASPEGTSDHRQG